MKKIAFIFLLTISALFIIACKKYPELKIYKLIFENENIEYSANSAEIKVRYSYPTTLEYVNAILSQSNYMGYSTIAQAKIQDSIFIVNFVDLQEDTKYYYKFECSNGVNVVSTDVRSFTIDVNHTTLPTVTTKTITNISATGAKCGGNITADGGSAVTARGVCWSTKENPTIYDSFTSDGAGSGSYVSTLTELIENKTYYVRAYAQNEHGTSYGNEMSFVAVGGSGGELPTVTTGLVTNITSTSAKCDGIVNTDGGSIVIARGVCWSTEHEPSINDDHTSNGSGVGEFNANITELTANTTYYVRAYAINAIGIAYGEQKMFTTLQELSLPTVTTNNVSNITSSSAVCGGEVTFNGNGIITARGVCWSTSTSPSLNDSHTNDGNGIGMFTSYLTDLNHSTVYYVRAYATNELGTSYGEIISFTTEQPTIPEGAIAGLFSVGVNHQVWFSQGNLQYQASTNIWKFAENQYDYIGESNNNISWIYNGWIDLFGWGTSGYNHGAIAYQPWSTSGNNADYYAYGDINNNLNDYTGQADWGYNPIYNGGNTENIWRTLSSEEWNYLLYQRGTYTGLHFALAIVNDINGIILLPDYWNNQYTLNDCDPAQGSYGLTYDSNIISLSDWTNILEVNGAVFLPAAGRRTPTNQNYGIGCYYWTTTIGDNGYVCQMQVELPYWVYYNAHASRFYGNSVRLVHDVN